MLNSLRNNAEFFRLFDKKKYIKHKLDRRSVDYVIEDSYDSNKYIGIRQLLRQRLKTALEERREFRNTNDLEDIELNTFERKEVINNKQVQQKTMFDTNDMSIGNVMNPVIIKEQSIPVQGQIDSEENKVNEEIEEVRRSQDYDWKFKNFKFPSPLPENENNSIMVFNFYKK